MSDDTKPDVIELGGMVLFWNGWPSQWYPSRFEVDGVAYHCAEQFMMAEKARFFGDEASRERIMQAEHPRICKELGRTIVPFSYEKWATVSRDVVRRGNIAKFSQNPELGRLLLATGDRVLVEASPYDTIWGVGLRAEDPAITDRSMWRGTNWLGEVLMQVREALRAGGLGRGGRLASNQRLHRTLHPRERRAQLVVALPAPRRRAS